MDCFLFVHNELCIQVRRVVKIGFSTTVHSISAGDFAAVGQLVIVIVVGWYGPSKMHFLKASPFGLVSIYRRLHVITDGGSKRGARARSGEGLLADPGFGARGGKGEDGEVGRGWNGGLGGISGCAEVVGRILLLCLLPQRLVWVRGWDLCLEKLSGMECGIGGDLGNISALGIHDYKTKWGMPEENAFGRSIPKPLLSSMPADRQQRI
ncbi:hypothetical protein Tco_0296373 [Tanacetum coccineum]